MKKLISFLLTFLLLPTLTYLVCPDVSAYIESDGIINLYEWEKYERIILFQGYDKSDSCYHSICIKCKYVEADRRVYVAVFAENGNNDIWDTNGINYSELYLSFDDSSKITVCSDGKNEYNKDEFFVKHGSANDDFGGVTYETEVLLKEAGFQDTITVYLQMKDYEGNLTQIFEAEIKSEELKEKESQLADEAEKESQKEIQENTEAVKPGTTNEKTTTQKENATQIKTAIIPEKYAPYSESLKKNNREVVTIGAACVITSLAALCVSIFKKDKKK